MRYVLAFLSIVALALCCSCGGNTSAASQSNVAAAPYIVISPTSANVAAGSTQQFVAQIIGLVNGAVLWSVEEGAAGGTIDASGTYTAPTASGTYHVIAQSQARASLSATATVTVYQAGAAQGLYFGSYSFAMNFYAVILPDDSFYSIEGNVATDGAMTDVFRLGSGPGMSNNGRYTASLQYVLFDAKFSSPLNGQYSAASLSGLISNASLTAAGLDKTQFDFTVPANLSHVTGSWTGLFLRDMMGATETGTVTIGSSGEITSGCYSGTITADASKNFFHVTMSCGQTISGVAVEMLLPNGVTRQLLIVMKDSDFGFAAMR